MSPYKSAMLTEVPRTLEKRLEIADALRALAAQDRENHGRKRRTEIASLRRDLKRFREDLLELWRGFEPRPRPRVVKYNPDQPRVPAGNADGGQWTSEGGSVASNDSLSDTSTPEESPKPGPRYAALETDTKTDASNSPAGVQYAGGAEEDDENENRNGGPQFEGTPAQFLRQEIAEHEYRYVLSRVLRFDPKWQPRPAFVDPNDIEGDITKLEAWTQEAKVYLRRLLDLARPLDRNTGDVISSSTQKTGDPFIDSTTEKLNDILDRVVARIGPRSDLTAGQYGQRVHDEFKQEVRAAHLAGIADEDLDKTFGVDEDASYGDKDSVRPDVVLRDDQGNIVAIYDVKTGRGFSSFKVIKYRLRTGSDSFIPIFELHPGGRTIWKQRRHRGDLPGLTNVHDMF